MTSVWSHRDSNIRKTWLLMTGFFLVVIAIGFGFSWFFDLQFILWIAVAIAVLMNVGAYWYSDKLVVKMTGAKPADVREYQELHRIVENLAITAGLPKPRVYVLDEQAPNAFATGRDPKHALVAVTTGLLALLERNELEGVIAHELSHIGNRDMLVSTVTVVLAGFIAILADIFLRMTFFGNHDRGDSRAGAVILVISIIIAILAPIAGKLIQLAVSRRREYLADASGVLLTRYPEGLAGALRKIAGHHQPMKRANHATAHLFLSNPFGPAHGLSATMNRLFATHPPIEERIRALESRG